MTLSHGELLYEGKAKRIYAGADAQQVLVEFKNDATAFNAQKKAQLEHKGRLNCQISACLFELLERHGIPTHYVGVADATWMVVQRVEVIPIEVVLRNTATGSLCRETPIAQGTAIDPALLDLYYKDDALGDPLLTDARIALLGVVSSELRQRMEALARQVNAVLQPFFRDLGLQLVDFKLELGLNQAGELLVADEISPDTCRLWDLSNTDANERILDKDRFRKDLGGVIEAYGEVCKRVQGACPQPRNCG
ncbi:phosphoribosylaminoimidazolesuccinocarboxamide synthase [Synechococcus sp. PROS-7-1]|uniref:phosphoribosylaminoimidazolesuccinocarboxamide synthase n=1 Tax=Synechococcus sp. PROS-7-1 TaxID=1442556 RepID=UPI0016452775|nr:phosphoribosylaminoimidazolesuccinocarboxamide synthase [Synechococcus sp. PROS-7-1]QNI86006.1 phosphoribosylaminoimidazolesuccinocarboxamide synthase [Synechococcus sp. PROS-7-1]